MAAIAGASIIDSIKVGDNLLAGGLNFGGTTTVGLSSKDLGAIFGSLAQKEAAVAQQQIEERNRQFKVVGIVGGGAVMLFIVILFFFLANKKAS